MSIVFRVVRSFTLLLVLFGGAVPHVHAQEAAAPAGQATTAARDEYVPLDQLPESEKLPAAPFLIGAYAVVWAAVLIYVLLLWRRLARVEADLREARRIAEPR